MDYEYLSGKKFSNAYYFKFQENILYDRLTSLVRLTKGKKVLHVGCCDHLPLIEEKIKKGEWLQKLLDDACEFVLGIDINQEAIEFVNRENYSKHKVFCADITSSESLTILPKYKFDFIILGEIVEHVNNPVDFLGRLKNNMDEYGFKGRYIITVPNAISTVRNGILNKGLECINTDHRFWFTPYTISKVMMEAGIKPEKILFSSFGGGGNGINRFTNKIFSIVEKIRTKPFAYKSWRGDQIIAIGKGI